MIYVSIVLIVIATDFLSKKYVKSKYEIGKLEPFYKDEIFIQHIRNSGIAFSKAADFTREIYMFTFSLLIILTFMLGKSLNTKDISKKLALSLIIGGGIGNYIDRLDNNGSVTDFIYLKNKKSPIFNFADIAIWLGSAICYLKIIKSFFTKK